MDHHIHLMNLIIHRKKRRKIFLLINLIQKVKNFQKMMFVNIQTNLDHFLLMTMSDSKNPLGAYDFDIGSSRSNTDKKLIIDFANNFKKNHSEMTTSLQDHPEYSKLWSDFGVNNPPKAHELKVGDVVVDDNTHAYSLWSDRKDASFINIGVEYDPRNKKIRYVWVDT